MGSFYATCSITRQTICDGQEMYMQFMIPNQYATANESIGQMFKESFLKVAKTKGLEEAIKTYEEATATWGSENELASKGMLVSNDGAYSKWVPFGPAIRGTYDDYGNIAPLDDEDSQNRVKILENLMGGLPFDTIMEVAQDDRWYTLGLGKYADNDDPNQNWRPEGISKNMPEWQLALCKKLSLTYFHAPVYDELSKFDFSAEERNGILKGQYDIKWKNEYIDPIKKKLPKLLESLKKTDMTDFEAKMELKWDIRELSTSLGMFRHSDDELTMIYLGCIAREPESLEWLYETLNVMYALSGMCISLDQAQYGSQHQNWFGWQRINKALDVKLSETMAEYYQDEEDEDEE